MATVAIVYYSATGTTRTAAEAVREGCASIEGITVDLLEIAGTDIVEGRWSNDEMAARLDAADAILFGTPTFMGSVSGQMKSFLDAMAPRWYTAAWRDKVGGAFSVSALASGDKLNALIDLVVFGMQMGMVWCGVGSNFATDQLNPNGIYLGAGVASGTGISETDLDTCRAYGARVGALAMRLADA